MHHTFNRRRPPMILGRVLCAKSGYAKNSCNNVSHPSMLRSSAQGVALGGKCGKCVEPIRVSAVNYRMAERKPCAVKVFLLINHRRKT